MSTCAQSMSTHRTTFLFFSFPTSLFIYCLLTKVFAGFGSVTTTYVWLQYRYLLYQSIKLLGQGISGRKLDTWTYLFKKTKIGKCDVGPKTLYWQWTLCLSVDTYNSIYELLPVEFEKLWKVEPSCVVEWKYILTTFWLFLFLNNHSTIGQRIGQQFKEFNSVTCIYGLKQTVTCLMGYWPKKAVDKGVSKRQSRITHTLTYSKCLNQRKKCTMMRMT